MHALMLALFNKSTSEQEREEEKEIVAALKLVLI